MKCPIPQTFVTYIHGHVASVQLKEYHGLGTADVEVISAGYPGLAGKSFRLTGLPMSRDFYKTTVEHNRAC